MEKIKYENTAGKFQRYIPHRKGRPWMMILVLLVWDGVLLYMIEARLIEPVYGGVFVALVSVYLGKQL